MPLIASIVDLSTQANPQKPSTTTAPLTRPVQFTEDQVKDTKTLARQLTALHQEVAQTTQRTRSHPEQHPVTFKNVACPNSGSKVTLTHNFGVFADFIVVRWSGASTTGTVNLVCDQDDGATALTDKNRISFRSYVAGTATIRLFPGA